MPNSFTTTSSPTKMPKPYKPPTTPEITMPILESGHHVPIISVVSNRQCIKIIEAAIDVGIPKPITRPKLTAKLMVANSFLPILPSKYWGTIGRNPSLNTAIPRFAKMDANAPMNIITIYFIILLSFFLNNRSQQNRQYFLRMLCRESKSCFAALYGSNNFFIRENLARHGNRGAIIRPQQR